MSPNQYNKDINVKKHKTLGYLYFLDQNHPISTGKVGFVYLHRHIMSVHLGRWLESHEHVHHIDENKENNEISNLIICDPSEHCKIHHPITTKNVEGNCLCCGANFSYILRSGRRRKYCSRECVEIDSRKIKNRPSIKALKFLVSHLSYLEVARIFGVSDNTIRKWMR